MKEVVIVSGVRTAIGAFGGSLKDVPVVKLGALVIRESMRRAGLRPKVGQELMAFAPSALKGEGTTKIEKPFTEWDKSLREVQVDEVIMGNVLPAGQGQNVARQAAIQGGMPKEVNAFTVNKLCASGMKSIALGAQAIMLDEADIIVAGGMESMSLVPYALPRARWGYRMDVNGRGEMLDLMVYDALLESFYGYHMGMTAENIARKMGITRREQDEIGLLSHQRAKKAIAAGAFKDEIVPVTIPQKKGEAFVFDTDERPMDTSLEKMGKLPPIFEEGGTVTAGNASGINDAAAAVVLMSKEKAHDLGLKPLAKIRSYSSAGIDPAYMGLGPIPASQRALKRAGLSIKDMERVELNEAFASQAIACIRDLKLDVDKTNLLGSGISLGHPVGCSGTRLVVTLLGEMARNNAKFGLATMCIGGGQGMAMILER